MQVGGNVNTLMQQVMAMRSPELLARMPEIEAMPWDDRVGLVSRGHHNIGQLIKGWDKFGPLMEAQGWTRQQVKQKLKGLKNARSKLEMGMRLADPRKIPKPFEPQAHSAFNVLAAWFLMDAGTLETLLTGPRIAKTSVSSLQAPAQPSEVPGSTMATVQDEVEDEVVEVGMTEGIIDVSNDAAGMTEDEVRDVAHDHYRD